MKDSFISVIIPVYNSEKTITRCIKSVLTQIYSNFELIVIDDGSSDNTWNMMLQFSSCPKVKIIRQKNCGVSVARNVGIKIAQGEYLAFIDADDYVKPTFLLNLVEQYTKGSNIDLAVIGLIEVKNNVYIKSVYKSGTFSSRSFLNYIFDVNGPEGYLWNKLWKTEIIKKYNIFLDKNVKEAEDLLFTIQYLLHANLVSINDVHDYYYVKSDNTLSSKFKVSLKSTKFISDYLQYKKTARKIYNLMPTNNKLNASANIVQINLGFIRNLNLNNVKATTLKKTLKKECLRYRKSYFKSSIISNKRRVIYILTIYFPYVMKFVDYLISKKK